MANPILNTKLAPIAQAQDRFLLRRKQALIWLSAAAIGVTLLFLGQQGVVLFPGQLAALVAITLMLTTWVRIRSRSQQIDVHELARRVEKEHPSLHSLLITAMDVEPDSETGDFTYLQKRVIREALAKNLREPWDQRGNERLFFTQAFHLLSFIAFLLVAVALGTSRPKPSATRAAFSGEVEVQPGNAAIERGSSAVITATFGKKVPAEATLVLLPADSPSRRLPLGRNLSDPVFGTSLMSVDSNTKYYVAYNGTRTEEFELKVFDYPALVQSDAELDYPDYTELPNRVIKDTRRITAVEGTDLTYSLVLNKAIEEGKFVGRDGSIIDLVADPDRSHTYRVEFPLLESNHYELALRDGEGRTNRISGDFVIRVKQNQLASLSLKTPLGDQRFSSVEEVEFEGEIWDDFGMGAYGFGYAIGANEPTLVEYGQQAAAKEKRDVKHLMEIEQFDVGPKSLISYYLWADDIGPDGRVRRNYSDMFFAEIRPFEEIFRENQSGQSEQQQGQGQQGNSPAMELAELQKEIINATWNIQRRESGRTPSEQYPDDINVVIESQASAIDQLQQLNGEIEREADRAKLQLAKEAMDQTVDHLSEAFGGKSTTPLPSAISTARTAYHYLLQLQPDEFQVSQQQGGGGGGGGNRSQQQLNQLEMTDDESRYETQSEAAGQQNEQQNEQLQILNRLKELARRQQDLNERLQELQTALNEAETEKEKEEIEQQLKRLRDQQREMVEDMDELRQRVADQNTPESSEALSQLDQIRSDAQNAAESLEDQQVSQALASGTRTQQDLEELRDDFRRKNSGQFNQAMQNLRARANQIAERQDQIQEDLEAAARNDQKSLGASEEANRVMEYVDQQKEEIQSVIEDIRSISEDSEDSEPLLSRQLYETYRSTDPAQLNEQLDYTSQLARLNLIEKAKEFEGQSHQAIDELKDRIDRAAESVLGDGVESLRRARLALDELRQEVENEIAGNAPTTDPRDPSQSSGTPPGEGAEASTGLGQRDQEPSEDAARVASREDTENEAQRGTPAGQGNRPGEDPREEQDPQLAQRGEGNQSLGAGQEAGQGNTQPTDPSPNPTSEGQQANREGRGDQGEDGQPGSRAGEGSPNSPRMAWNMGGNESNSSGSGGGGGPITGRNFTEFSDQLRAVEEMIDMPELQNEVAAVRDRARAMRIDYKRHGKEPQWDLVEMEIEKPLAEIRRQVGDELARRLSREAVVPIDRDPVPQQYSELVRRYYETLGEGE